MGSSTTSRILMGLVAVLVMASRGPWPGAAGRRRRVDRLSRSAVASTPRRTTTTAPCSWSRRKASSWRTRSTLNSRNGSRRSSPHASRFRSDTSSTATTIGTMPPAGMSSQTRPSSSVKPTCARTWRCRPRPPRSRRSSGSIEPVAKLDENRNGVVEKSRSVEHRGRVRRIRRQPGRRAQWRRGGARTGELRASS